MGLIGLAALSWPAAGSADPFGALTQLPGVQGCVRDGGGLGCTRGRGIGVTTDVAVSPEGRNVYATGIGLGVFARDEPTGALAQLGGRSGCLTEDGSEGCGRARGWEFGGAYAVTVSRDGRNVYVTNDNDGGLAIFARDQASGGLHNLAGRAGCARPRGRGRCARARGLESELSSITVSPDGRNVYEASGALALAGVGRGGVASFSRDPVTGALHQLSGRAGCVTRAGRDGCARGRALGGASAVAVSPDGRDVYVASGGSQAVAIFARNQATGSLRQLRGKRGYVHGSLSVPGAIAVSPDGQNVYAAGFGVWAFARDQLTGGLRQLSGRAGCIAAELRGCARPHGFDGLEAVAVSPEGRNVYVAAGVGVGSLTGIAALSRDQTNGGMAQLAGRAGCVSPRGSAGCTPGRGLQDASSVAVSPDGRNVYVAASELELLTEASGAVAVFARSPG